MLDFTIKEITVSYGMTLNIGNYESFRVDAQVTLKSDKVCADQDEFNALEASIFETGWEIVKEQIKRKVDTVRNNSKL
jgi:hypothetical protein